MARWALWFGTELAVYVADNLDQSYYVQVTKRGDHLFTPNAIGRMSAIPLRVLRHDACGRRVKIQNIGRVQFILVGYTGKAIVCEHCAFRLEIPARIRTVKQLKNHFIRFNM